jgi:hypothetical protein
LLGFAKDFDIEQVLIPPARELVSDQVFARDDAGYDLFVKDTLNSVCPSFVEGNSVYALKNIDAVGGAARSEALSRR